MAVARPEASQLRLDLIGIDQSGLQDRRALDKLRGRCGSGRGRCTTLVVEGDALDPALVGDHGDAHHIATWRAAGGTAGGADGCLAPAAVVGEIGLEEVAIHAIKLRRLQPAVFRPGLVTRVA